MAFCAPMCGGCRVMESVYLCVCVCVCVLISSPYGYKSGLRLFNYRFWLGVVSDVLILHLFLFLIFFLLLLFMLHIPLLLSFVSIPHSISVTYLPVFLICSLYSSSSSFICIHFTFILSSSFSLLHYLCSLLPFSPIKPILPILPPSLVLLSHSYSSPSFAFFLLTFLSVLFTLFFSHLYPFLIHSLLLILLFLLSHLSLILCPSIHVHIPIRYPYPSVFLSCIPFIPIRISTHP